MASPPLHRSGQTRRSPWSPPTNPPAPALRAATNGASADSAAHTGTWTVKAGLAQMLKGGVIMDVVTPEQAKIAEEAGACAVMALERVPSDIRKDGGVARMSDPDMITGIIAAVTIPVMAKARIGHFVEAQILEALGVDYIDESEVLTPADEAHHIDKHQFKVPFVCGCRNLGEALRRISEGAAMIRTKGEAGTGNVVEAVRHMRTLWDDIRRCRTCPRTSSTPPPRNCRRPYELVKYVHDHGKLPVVNFSAGGIATPADAALMMQLGAEGNFVGSRHLQVGEPGADGEGHREGDDALPRRLRSSPRSRAALGTAMKGLEIGAIPENEILAKRGW